MAEVENASVAIPNDVTQHAFVSYSRSNSDAMQNVARALKEANIPVWTDERLVAGTPSWKNSIELALQGAFCVVVLMSPTAKSSEWVERELDYAYILQRPIYPVLIKGSQRDAVPFELINMQYIDARTDFNQGINQLISLLRPYTTKAFVPLGSLPKINDKFLESEPKSVFSLEPVPTFSNRYPSALDVILYSFGIRNENIEVTPEYTLRLRKLVYWYFLKPRKFRLFSVMTQDSTARFIHAAITMMIYLWVFGIFLLLQIVSANSRENLIQLFLLPFFCYGIVVLVPITNPYKNRRSFFGAILYSLLLLGLIVILLGIAYLLLSATIVASGKL